MQKLGLGLAACFVILLLPGCPPKSASLVINNIAAVSPLLTPTDPFPCNTILGVQLQGPNDLSLRPNALGAGEAIQPGDSATIEIPVAGGNTGDWSVEVRYSYDLSPLGCRVLQKTVLLEDIVAGDVFTWNWDLL